MTERPKTRVGRRVVLTGAGAVSSIGVGTTEFLAGLRAGRSEVRPISEFDTAGFEHANGCEVTGFEPKRWIERLDPEHLGRAAQFTVAAARMAASDAGLDQDTLDAGRVVIAVGTTDGETRLKTSMLLRSSSARSPRAVTGTTGAGAGVGMATATVSRPPT